MPATRVSFGSLTALLLLATGCSPGAPAGALGLGGAGGMAGANGATDEGPREEEDRDECGGCPEQMECCAGTCVVLDDDPEHCGSCGRACSTAGAEPTCERGECALTCSEGFVDCDGKTKNGCEASDPGVPTEAVPLRPSVGAFTGSLLAASTNGALRPTFTWRAAEGGACGSVTYHLQVDDSCPLDDFSGCAFESPELDERTSELALAPARDLPVSKEVPVGTRYFWRVRACDAQDRCSAFSKVRYLDVGRERQDVNGDGYADIVSFDELQTFRYSLYLGGAVMGAVDNYGTYHVEPARSFDEVRGLGAWWSKQHPPVIRFVGDVNGDGFHDFVADGTAQNIEHAGGDDGAAVRCPSRLLYLGAADVADIQPVLFSTQSWAPDSLAHTFAAGDVDGDGYADLWAAQGVGAPDGDATSPSSELDPGKSAVFLLRGGADVLVSASPPEATGALPIAERLAPTLTLEARPDDDGALLGVAVEAGDFDGDGLPDVAFVAPYARLVYLALGSSGDAAVDRAIPFGGIGADGRECAGARLSVGDFDADGFDDFVVGCGEQRVIAGFLGGAPLPEAMAFEKVINPEGDGGLHEALALDLDGDGREEIVTGGGQVYAATLPSVWLLSDVQSAGGPRRASTLPLMGAAGYFGAGDHNGDGYVDLFVAGAMTVWIPGGPNFDELAWPYDATSQVNVRYFNTTLGLLQTRVVAR